MFLLVSTSLMFAAGLGGSDPGRAFAAPGREQLDVEGNPEQTIVDRQEKDIGAGGSQSFTSKLIQCGASFATGAFAGLIVGCPFFTKIATFLAGVITTLVNYFGFMFKLLTLQLGSAVPGAIVVFVYYPAFMMVGYIAFSRIRAVSS